MRFARISFVAACFVSVAGSVGAQGVVRVIRHTPGDSGTPTGLITATFDRPLSGVRGANIDPHDVVKIEPALEGEIIWRDPVTVQFSPARPLRPGMRVAVTIDTTFRGPAGIRLATPYRFSFRVSPARPLAAVTPDNGWVGPRSTFQIMYNAPVDLDSLKPLARVEFENNCEVRRIALVPRSQTPITETSPRYWESWTGDSIVDRMRRIVELEPASPLPAGCRGYWHVPSLDPDRPGDTWRYQVTVYPTPRLTLQCPSVCDGSTLLLDFGAPIRPAELVGRFTISPRPQGALQDTNAARTQFRWVGTLAPRTRYTVRLDSSVRDSFGRRLASPIATIDIPDRPPTIHHAEGAITLRRNARTVSVKTVNVDSIRVTLLPIPDSLRGLLLGRNVYTSTALIDQLRPALRDTTVLVIPVRGVFNQLATTDVALPASVGRTAYTAVAVDIARSSTAPDSVGWARRRVTFHHVGRGVQFVQVSDLVAHVKSGGDQGAVFVTTATGAPVSGAAIDMIDGFRNLRAAGRTDREGLAVLRRHAGDFESADRAVDPGRNQVRFLEIRTANDRLTVPVIANLMRDNQELLAPGSLGVSQWPAQAIHAVITKDRGIYRPGETIFFRIDARRGWRGRLEPATDSIRIRLGFRYDLEDTLWSRAARLSPNGVISDSIPLSATVRPGYYTIHTELRDDGRWRPLASEGLQVAEYRAPEFALRVTSDSAPHVVGDTVAFAVSAEYLFGAPMAGGAVRWSASLTDNWGAVLPSLPEYTVGIDRWWWRNPYEYSYRELSNGTDTLDRAGTRTLRVATNVMRPTNPSTLTVSVAAMEVTNRAVTRSASVVVHPVATYIAVRPSSRPAAWKKDSAVGFDIMAVSPGGRPRPSVPIRVTVRRVRFVPSDTAPFVSGRRGRWQPDTIETHHVVSDTGPVRVDFTPRTADHFDLLFEAIDDQGRPTATSLHGTVAGAMALYWQRPTNPFQLTLKSSSDSVRVGETVSVAFESPFPLANAWITTEREGILTQRRVTVAAGPNTVTIPVAAMHVPNLFVGVTLVRRAERGATDSLLAEMRAGYAHILVDRSSKRLTVVVEPGAKTYTPGDTTTIRVSVRDSVTGRGVRAALALWAVDEGVLALTHYTVPDLLEHLYRRVGIGTTLRSSYGVVPISPVSFMQMRAASAARTSSPSMQLSEIVLSSDESVERAKVPFAISRLDDTEAGPRVRSSFRSTAFFLGDVTTSDDGMATVRAPLPDNVTTFRIMAVATSGDRYGKGESQLLLTRDLVLRPALPRFLRPGDSLSAAAVVNVRSGESDQVRVGISLTGATLGGDSTQTGNVGGGRPMLTRFALRVPTDATTAIRAVMTAVGRLGDDAAATTLPLAPVGTPRAHTVTGVVRDSATIEIDLPSGLDPLRSTISLAFGGSPIAAIRSNYARLRAWPYYATECVVSAGRALIALHHAETALNDRSRGMDSAYVARELQRAVDAIARRENDGMIKEWDSDYPHQPVLSIWSASYAGDFLIDAAARGARVSTPMIGRIAASVDRWIDNEESMQDTITGSPFERRSRRQAWLGTKVVAAKFLRRAGRPDAALEQALIDQATEMRWEDRLWLADLLADAGKTAEARAMVDRAWMAVKPIGRRLDLADSLRGFAGFPSHVRPAARLMVVTMRLDPEHRLAGALSETVMQQGRAERDWAWNTQDYSTAAIALADFAVKTRMNAPRSVTVSTPAGRVLLQGSTDMTATIMVPLDGVLEPVTADSSRVRVKVTAAGPSNPPAYFSVTITEVAKAPPVTPDITGIVVERWYESFETGKPIREATEGELVRVRLQVTVPADRQFVALEDMLPAGLEPVDLSLRTEGLGPFGGNRRAQPRAEGMWQGILYGGWDNGWWTPWEHKEIHDDRVIWTTRQLWAGTYAASYIARAAVSGVFIKPPAHAEEMYDPAVQGRTDGGVFVVRRRN